jgi:hypothetical protein
MMMCRSRGNPDRGFRHVAGDYQTLAAQPKRRIARQALFRVGETVDWTIKCVDGHMEPETAKVHAVEDGRVYIEDSDGEVLDEFVFDLFTGDELIKPEIPVDSRISPRED